MRRRIFLTDHEPIDPEKNPVLTLEEASADARLSFHKYVMEELRRDQITRLQAIEYSMAENGIRKWTGEREFYINELPRELAYCGDEDEVYVPDYLRGKIERMYEEVPD